MHRISRSLIDRILDQPNHLAAVGEIGQYIHPRDEQESNLGLSRPELNLFMFLTYDAEVCRNGHAWFFLNPSADEVTRILTALEEMGLTNPRAILIEAGSVFPNGVVPTSQELRNEVIKTLPHEETMALWDRLDQSYSGQWENYQLVMKQVMIYLREHREDLLRPETA